jgi:hypothetical protein
VLLAHPFLSIQLDCRTPRPARTNLRAERRRRSEAIPTLADASKVAGEPENHEHQHDKSEESATVVRAAPSSTSAVVRPTAAEQQHE